MSRVLAQLSLLCIASSAAVGADVAQERGYELALMADRANDGYVGEESKVELSLINAHGDVSKRLLRLESMEVEGDGDRSILTFEWPADLRSTKFLVWAHKGRDDDRWLYLPSMRRVKRIAGRKKSGSFMGSEFSYEDIGGQEPKKYRWRYLGELELDGRKAWSLERIALDTKGGYSKELLSMDKEYLLPLEIKYFDKRGEILKTAEFKGYKRYGKYWRASKIVMTNHQTNKKSIFRWLERKLKVSMSKSNFNRKRLRD